MGKSKTALADELKAVWAHVQPEDESDDLVAFFSMLLVKQMLRKRLLNNLDNVLMKHVILFAARLFNLIEIEGFERLREHLNTLTFRQAYAKILAIDCFRSRGFTIDLHAPAGCDFTVMFAGSTLNIKIATFTSCPSVKTYLNRLGKKRRGLRAGTHNVICSVFPEVTEENVHQFGQLWRQLNRAAAHFVEKTRRVDFIIGVSETIELVVDQQSECIVDRQIFDIARGPNATNRDSGAIQALMMGEAVPNYDLPPTTHPFESYWPWLAKITEQRSGKEKWWKELAPVFKEEAKSRGWGPIVDEVAFRFRINVEWLSRYAGRPLEIAFSYVKAGNGRLVNASSTTEPSDAVTIYDSVEAVFRKFFRYAMAASPSFLGFEFSAPHIAAPQFPAGGPTDVATRFRHLPELELDAVRERFAHALQVAAWDIITLHEVGHIYSGHNDLRKARQKGGSPLSVQEMRALEIDADAFAIASVLEIWRTNGMKFLGPTEDMIRVPWLEERFGENATGYFIVLTSYYCIVRLDLDTEWSLESETAVHPAPPVRRIHNLFTAIMHMEKIFPWLRERVLGSKFDLALTPMSEAEELYNRVNRLPAEAPTLASEGVPEIEQLKVLVEQRNALLAELEPFQRGPRMVTVS